MSIDVQQSEGEEPNEGGASGPGAEDFGHIPDLAHTSEGLAVEVERLVGPTVTDLGYVIVRVQFAAGARRQTLQIMAERPDGSMALEDCETVSRAISALLEVEDPIPGAYDLEVSSPGIDRPLTRLRDFARFAGFEAKVELTKTAPGRRRFSGRLLGVEGEDVVIAVPGEAAALKLPFADLAKAKLVLTDELLAAGGGPDDKN